MIIGTAGHIDHGKTTLVRALTGVDTDRLPEEKRRGITIELGFAPLDLDGIGTVGVVDVPGHEAFVHTMLAGAAGMDAGLLVVAADDGIRPQTREHLTILNLLGVRGGVVALTKCDLAEPDWVDLVEEDVRALVAGTVLQAAPIIRVRPGDHSALVQLRQALAHVLRNAATRDSAELFRLPVDRVFTVKGTGTVVTGTAWSGTLQAEQDVRVLPGERRARVRGMQMHGADVGQALPGARMAIALGGVSTDQVHRGNSIVVGEAWTPALVLRADLSLLAEAPGPLGPRTVVRFHLGTAEVGARVVGMGGAVQPGERRAVRIVLDAPVVARAGDRFVLRTPSPAATVGGGVITDAIASRRSRPFSGPGLDVGNRLAAVLREAGGRGVPRGSLAVRVVGAARDVDAAIQAAGGVSVGDSVYSPAIVATGRTRLLTLLDGFHREHPLAEQAPVAEIRAALQMTQELANHLLALAARDGDVIAEAAWVRRSAWQPKLDSGSDANLQWIVDRILRAGFEPPTVGELRAQIGRDVVPLLKLAESGGKVVQVEVDRYFATDSINQIIKLISGQFPSGSAVTPAQVRDVLGVSRKYVIPLLEYFDRVGITQRRGEGRVWLGGGKGA